MHNGDEAAARGFLKLPRSVFANSLWTEPRRHSAFEAWIDILQRAAWRNTVVFCRGEAIPLVRGEVLLSLRKAAERWGWGSDKAVRTFLKRTHREGLLRTQGETQAGGRYLVVNYDAYGDVTGVEDAPADAPKTQRSRANGRKNKEVKNTTSPLRGTGGGETWLTPYLEAHAANGHIPAGRLASVMKRLEKLHPPEDVLLRWARFCDSDEVRFGPNFFERNFGRWASTPTNPVQFFSPQQIERAYAQTPEAAHAG